MLHVTKLNRIMV